MDRCFGIDKPPKDVPNDDDDSSVERSTRSIYRMLNASGRWLSRSQRTPSRHGTRDKSNHRIEMDCAVDVETPPTGHHPAPGPGAPFEFHGSEPPVSPVPRTVDVGRHPWESFVKASLGRPSSGMFTNFFQAQDAYDNYQSHESSDVLPSHRSVLGLPVLSPYSRRHHLWTVTINTIDATYTAFLVPIIVAFIGRAGDDVSYLTSVLELTFGCFFLADIFINLHVGFVLVHDYKKKVIMNGKHILWYYLKYGGAWIDVLSIIPLVYQLYVIIFLGFDEQSDDVAVLRLFRLLRIFRILKKIFGGSCAGTTTSIGFGIKAPAGVVYLASVVYSMLVMMNFLGCLLFYIAHLEDENLEGTWVFKYIQATRDIPDDVDSDTHVLKLIDEHTQAELYLTSLYWAVTTVTTVGYGDITPNTFTEMIALIVVMLSHIMLFGLLIGSISELVKSSLKSVQFQEETKRKVEAIRKWMKYRRLPQSTVRKINSYYTEIQRQTKDFQEEEILDELPLSLRIEVIYKVTKDLMRTLKVFTGIEDSTLRTLAGRLVPITLPPGRELVRQGDSADALYILEDGTMSVLFNEVTVYYIEGPETCAETGILSNFLPQLTRHPATLRTFTSCMLWKLSSKDLKPVFAMDARLRDGLIDGYRLRVLKSLENTTRSKEIEKKVEAEFGCKMNNVQAVRFKSMLERTRVMDGTFRKLIEDVVTSRFIDRISLRTNQRSRDGNETSLQSVASTAKDNHLTDEELCELQELTYHIRQDGEFGMIKFVGRLKAVVDDRGKLDLDGLRQVSSGMNVPLKPRLLLLTFTLFDKQESNFVDVDGMLEALRSRVDFAKRESHIVKLFSALDDHDTIEEERGDGVLTLAEVVRRFRVESHPDVISGDQSTMAVLKQFVTAMGHEDVTLDVFIDFHKYLSMCVEDDDRFFTLTRSLWAHVRDEDHEMH